VSRPPICARETLVSIYRGIDVLVRCDLVGVLGDKVRGCDEQREVTAPPRAAARLATCVLRPSRSASARRMIASWLSPYDRRCVPIVSDESVLKNN
jgi:hypothetical protein